MIGKLAKVIWVLAGLFCLLALADRWEWTQPLWEKVLPEVVLARRPSPSEIQISQLCKRMSALKRKITDIAQAKADSTTKRHDLLERLSAGISTEGPIPEVEQLMKNDPVATALVWSVDAEDRRLLELERDLTKQTAELARLEARVIALRNGVSQVDPAESVKPSDELRAENSGETDYDRYRRIICEATQLIQ